MKYGDEYNPDTEKFFQRLEEHKRKEFLRNPPSTQDFLRQYLGLYRQASDLFNKYNPCKGIPGGGCLGTKESGRCCGGCPHHSPSVGCTVMSLGCKIWFCGYVAADKEFVRKLLKISKEVDGLYVYPGVRDSLPEVLRNFRTKLKWRRDVWKLIRFKGENYHGLSLKNGKITA